ncbi:hypothetical protein J2W25_006744 [Variovorax boronicumulans]|uniref:Uncharacterized protein n=1 Tax=Variovorax boronicumulans TaxID=436515 RepID=A0AAW8E728_9BURK|nr:hypothetical protein [Variovorax boronicumulans]MDP9882404.1 hypothetical protein [Variovorax boronicumulans]MDP9927690.1 hypothetical protein [Variovorax boronicumulans]
MNEVSEEFSLGYCSSCPNELGEVMFTLSLCDLEPEELSSQFKWTATGGVAFGQYCLDCGIEAAEEELGRLGIGPKSEKLTDENTLCACCGKGPVNAQESVSACTIDIDRCYNDGDITTLANVITVLVCEQCEKLLYAASQAKKGKGAEKA